MTPNIITNLRSHYSFRRGFAVNIARFFISMLPISCVNQWLKYGLGELALNFRCTPNHADFTTVNL